jgi:hypothetical protein
MVSNGCNFAQNYTVIFFLNPDTNFTLEALETSLLQTAILHNLKLEFCHVFK